MPGIHEINKQLRNSEFSLLYREFRMGHVNDNTLQDPEQFTAFIGKVYQENFLGSAWHVALQIVDWVTQSEFASHRRSALTHDLVARFQERLITAIQEHACCDPKTVESIQRIAAENRIIPLKNFEEATGAIPWRSDVAYQEENFLTLLLRRSWGWHYVRDTADRWFCF